MRFMIYRNDYSEDKKNKSLKKRFYMQPFVVNSGLIL